MKLLTSHRSEPLTVSLDDYEEISIDRIFDVLEKILDARADDLDHIKKHSAHMFDSIHKYLKATDSCEREIAKDESIWDQLREDYDAKYYIKKNLSGKFDDFHSISEIAKVVFKIKPITLTKEWVETNYILREYKAKKEIFPAEEYLIPASIWARYEPDMTISEYDDCEAYAEQQNKKYRIVKCKRCGGYEIVSREYDEKLLSHGLQPVQNCAECRRHNRELHGGSADQTRRT